MVVNLSKKGSIPRKGPSPKTGLGRFVLKLRQRKIITTLAAFIGGGWLLLEFVHWLLVDHYHFPEKAIDITFITILGTLVGTLLWRWFSGREAPRKFKLELVLIPLVVLITVLLDINLLLHLKAPESETVPASKWKNSIAVLPFVDMSPQKDQEYFCDGMTEELINRLSNIKELKVPARTSAFMFKGKAEDIREIGRKLDVQTVLEGSIRKEDHQLRITVQLVNVSDSYHIWSETFDRELTKVFSIQDEVALAIADKLKLTLAREDKTKLVKRPTENLEAYNLYLQGRYFWNKRTAEEIRKAIDFFNQAIERDSHYALAYVGLADCYLLLPSYGRFPIREVLPKAKEAVSRALEVDDTLAEAHTSLAAVIESEGAAADAEREYKRAIELNPNYPMVHLWYHVFLRFRGRLDEAEAEIRRAKELDPLSLIINSGWGDMLYLKKKYDQAIQQYSKTLELDQSFAEARRMRGKCYQQKGMFEEAIADFQKAREDFGNNPYGLGDLGNAYAVSGEKTRAIEVLKNLLELSKQGYSLNYDIAFVYCGLGDKDKAFEYLEKAYNVKEEMADFKVDPAWESLRSDPRYQPLLERLHLE
jgi:TolB-like protein/Flp pilus assembly protein TadD